jgi:nitrite reductase/ring-hydroxylating ferredoxin subunit
MSASRIAVCDIEELPSGERLLVEVDDEEICLLNVDGDLFALGARCAHRGGPICKGELRDPASEDDDSGSHDLAVVCPWHGWTYDVETGGRVGPTDHSLPAYPVAVEDGTVYLVVESEN